MYTLVDKVAIVTGGANGVGAGIVKEFLKEHAKFVAILDIDQPSGIELEKEMLSVHGKERARFFKCDVTNDGELHNIFDTIIQQFGIIDVVVNNAGICNENLDAYKKEIAVNFTALVSSTLKALQLMRVDQGGKGGTIINISSAVALTQRSPIPFVYAATKSAVLQFSNCIGMEGYYQHTKVRIVTVCFGATETNMFNNMVKTCDNLIHEAMLNIQNYNRETNLLQSSDTAARGVVESYKKGKSGSTWLVNTSKIYNVSEDVDQAYSIMSKNVAF